MLNPRGRLVASALICSALIVACGSRGERPGATGSPSPSPTPSTPTASPVGSGSTQVVQVVDGSSSGKTVELRVGEYLRVELEADYQQPTARPGDVLERTSATGGYPTRRSMIATFRAVKAGGADVESSTDYECLHATPSCALPQQTWSIHVVVKAS